MAERSIRDPSAPPLRARHAVERSVAVRERPVRVRPRSGAPAPAEPASDARSERRTRPDSRRTDRRRLIAALLSSVLPGTGQALNGRIRAALTFLVPSIALVAAAWWLLHSDTPAMLVARAVAPPVLAALLVLNVVVLAWRLLAVLQAFLDRRYPLRPGRLGAAGLAVLVVVTAVPHLLAWSYGSAAQSMFGRIFAGSPVSELQPTAPQPGTNERLNVLLIGVDSGPGREEALTDSLIVVSLDPVGRTVTMVSIPRDLASVPLGNGNTYGPKINSLMSYAGRNPKEFPDGGVRTLEKAVGALFGIPIHAYASVDLAGFARMVDAVGGVDIDVKKPLDDPRYPRLDGGHGWSVTAGPHHFDGLDALAYARVRKVVGESDLTRAARQQEVLVALRNQAVGAGLLFRLPQLMDAVGSTVRTDLPMDQLPQLAAMAEQIGGRSAYKFVLGAPQIKGASGPYGSVFLPVPARIRAMAKVVFGTPGGDPTWPVPKPSVGPSASAGAPDASTAP
ncbi:MAG TPA: LCP family protein [Candidatus Limnocylindrales bacterium]|nr:LCP family protein [Candidatus Limnocylindrales bacterium]